MQGEDATVGSLLKYQPPLLTGGVGDEEGDNLQAVVLTDVQGGDSTADPRGTDPLAVLKVDEDNFTIFGTDDADVTGLGDTLPPGQRCWSGVG